MFIEKYKPRRVATIQDLSGFGRCSLSVALPIISACSIETCAIPTALLSTHTGGFDGYTCKDLSSELLPIAKHWKSLNLHFDALYSGFLASREQIEIVSDIFDMLKSKDTIVLVDPCIADNGKLYSLYDKSMINGMRKLCSKADVIVPNMTEAAFLLDQNCDPNASIEEMKEMARNLTKLGCNKVVITGVNLENDIGAICYDKDTNQFNISVMNKCPVNYFGTGDIFASVLISCLVRNLGLYESMRLAVSFCSKSIEDTFEYSKDKRFGVNFESNLSWLANQLAN